MSSPPVTWRETAAAARTPRMLAMLALFVVAALVFGRLGAWQLDRAFEKRRVAAAEQVAAEAATGPVPISDVLAPQTGFRADLAGTWVQATGAFDADGQLEVTGRELAGQTGSLVLTPLRVDQGDGTTALLPVIRGWLPDGADLPDPPAGPVDVVGWLNGGESAGPITGGQTDAISPAALVNYWGGPIYSAYLVAAEAEAPLAAAERPADPSGGGLNLQNLTYALEWWLFGAFALVLWVRIVRDAARDARADAQDGPASSNQVANSGP